MQLSTGKSFSEALILASVNPPYDERLFIELQEKKSYNALLNIRFLWKQKLSRTLIVDYNLGSQQQDKLIKREKNFFFCISLSFCFSIKELEVKTLLKSAAKYIA